MPLAYSRKEKEFSLAVWKVEEENDFFISKLSLTNFDLEEIEKLTAKNKLSQWYASRYLLKVLFETDETLFLLKDEFGKPYIRDSSYRISISHCRDYAAAIISKQHCGIDVETIDKRIESIASKFLYDHEIVSEGETKPDVKKLTIYWSAKETLYKLYGLKGLTFKSQLLIRDFQPDEQGDLVARISLDGHNHPFTVHYHDFGDYILSYSSGLLENNGT